MKTYQKNRFIVDRDPEQCIKCQVCVRQCGWDTHSYVPEFDEMFAAAKLEPIEIAVTKLAEGYWMQRDFRFALKLPAGWRPAFGPNDRVLFFAVGAAHGLFTDALSVLASPPKETERSRPEPGS